MKDKSLALIIFAVGAIIGIFLIVAFLKGFGTRLFLTLAGTSGWHPVAAMESIPSGTSYRPLSIDAVTVDTGMGSPVPVQALISGSLPDTCAQIEFIEQSRSGSTFVIQLATIPFAAADCIQAPLSFRMSLPLNVSGLPAGDYAVEANDVRTVFNLAAGPLFSDLPDGDAPVAKDVVQVAEVKVESGAGLSIPAKAVVLGNLPVACSWLGEIRMRREEQAFSIWLTAHRPAQVDCPRERQPFRLELPLNTINLPAGSYTANVNGVSAGFDLALHPLLP